MDCPQGQKGFPKEERSAPIDLTPERSGAPINCRVTMSRFIIWVLLQKKDATKKESTEIGQNDVSQGGVSPDSS